MIIVHHLNESRSQRILWLLEELGTPYEIQFYYRDRKNMAPQELRAVHPLRKSPVITDGDRVIAESGAIIDYIVRRCATGRLHPTPESNLYDDYVHWLHYAEGSASLPFVIRPIAATFGRTAAPLARRVDYELALTLGYINDSLHDRPYLLGDDLSAADIQMSFVGELACATTDVS